MSYLQGLKSHLESKTLLSPELSSAIDEFHDLKVEERKNKPKIMPFGKYKGMTIEELLSSEIGRTYCKWLLKQTFFQKFQDLHEEIKKHLGDE